MTSIEEAAERRTGDVVSCQHNIFHRVIRVGIGRGREEDFFGVLQVELKLNPESFSRGNRALQFRKVSLGNSTQTLLEVAAAV